MKIFSSALLAFLCSTFFSLVELSLGERNTSVKLMLTPDGEEPEISVIRGSTVTIHCGHPSDWVNGTQTVWIKDGEPMKDDDEHHIIFNNKNLHFEKAKLSDTGHYVCEHATDDEDGNKITVVRRGMLKVMKSEANSAIVPPAVELESEEEQSENDCANVEPYINTTTVEYLCFQKAKMHSLIAKPAGLTVLLPCRPRGNPKPTITWYFNDKIMNLVGDYTRKIKPGGLQISDAAPKDEGPYRCEATSGNLTESFSFHFVVVPRVTSKPIFEEPPRNVTLIVGQTLELRVKILSDPEYTLIWARVPQEGKPYPVESRTSNATLKMNSHYLILENVTKEDEGEYACLAGNTIGTSVKTAFVKVLTEPPVPVQPSVQDAPTTIYRNVWIVFFACCVGIAIVSGSCGLWTCVVQKRNKKNMINHHYSTVKKVLIEKKSFQNNDELAVVVPEINIKNVSGPGLYTDQEYEFPLDVSWEFPRERLEIGKHLGEGAFGEVKLGIANGIIETGILTKVAVKSLKRTHNDAEMIDLMSEMETMKELGQHKNIINLLGCCTQGGELLVIMEFAENGNLRDYLRANRHHFTYERPHRNVYGGIIPIDVNDPSKQTDPSKQEQLSFADLMSMAYQVARGMDYLVQRKYVHRDLAARNVLVCANKVVKIADFGMTRSTFTNDYYRKKSDGRVPVKWMAPETLFHKIYTTQSDVWSYGILLWEIVTLGGTPYPSMPDVTNLLEYLKSGRRMDQPSNCPTELYLIMRDCWMESPTSRPSFSDLVEDIRRILYIASGTEYMDLEGVQPFEYAMIETPPSSPEHSGSGAPFFDPEFIKSFSQS